MGKCMCEDVECKFRHTSRVADKAQYECSLDLADAIMFLKRFNVTTCEVGMGQEIINDQQVTDNIINRLKYNGRL